MRRKTLPEALICWQYTHGMTTRAIAAECGVSHPTISAVLRRNHMRLRDASAAARKYRLDELVFRQQTPQANYWIGFLMADGNISGTAIDLRLVITDEPHIRKFQSFLKTDRPISYVKSKVWSYKNKQYVCKRQARLTVQSPLLVRDLARFGVTPNKSKRAAVLGLDMNKDFWRGVFDGDGSISDNGLGALRVACLGSEQNMRQFVTFVRSSLGTVGPQRRVDPVRRTASTAFEAVFYSKTAVALMRLLYEDCAVALDRKEDLWDCWITSSSRGWPRSR